MLKSEMSSYLIQYEANGPNSNFSVNLFFFVYVLSWPNFQFSLVYKDPFDRLEFE